jgi:hypothetical protein
MASVARLTRVALPAPRMWRDRDVKPEVEDLIERLRHGRSMPLLRLRLTDDAQLDGPVETDPDAGAVVHPCRWLLERIGVGVRLTQAGCLPPDRRRRLQP